MRNDRMIGAVLLASLFGFGGTAMADGNPSADYGRQLFDGTTLSGPGGSASCSACHPGGKGVKTSKNNPELAKKINKCITGPLKGKALPVDSREMQSLILYIRSL